MAVYVCYKRDWEVVDIFDVISNSDSIDLALQSTIREYEKDESKCDNEQLYHIEEWEKNQCVNRFEFDTETLTLK